MAKVDNRKLREIHQYRADGMIYALAIVKTKGIEELEREVNFRKLTYMPIELNLEWTNNLMQDIFNKIYNSMNVVTFKVLNEVFGFGKERLHRFEEEFDKITSDLATVDCYGERLYTFEDYAKLYNEKYDMQLNLDKVRLVDAVNESSINRGADMESVEKLLEEHGFKDAADFLKDYMKG